MKMKNQNRIHAFQNDLMTTVQQDIVEAYLRQQCHQLMKKMVVSILIVMMKKHMNLCMMGLSFSNNIVKYIFPKH